jgi:peptidoglycan/LPS O-acetylase OafA/YrhL
MNLLPNDPHQIAPHRIYFPELDGLRFLAFLLVFIHHHQLFLSIPQLAFLSNFGWIGVDLFLTLSAFLITKLLIEEHQKTGQISFKFFFLRRILRIWPPYFLTVLLSICVSIYLNGVFDFKLSNRLMGLLTFTDNIISAFKGFNPLPYTTHLWTISYEEQFYIVIPFAIYFLIKCSKQQRLKYFFIICFVGTACKLLFIFKSLPHPVIWTLPFAHFESILLGVAIAFGGLNFLLNSFSTPVIGIFGIVCFAVLCFLPNINTLSYALLLSYLLVGLSTSCVVFAVLNNNFLKKILSQKVLVFLGKRSYGLYLFHFLGNGFAGHLSVHYPMLPNNLYASFAYSFLFSVAAAIISYQFLEKPFLKLKTKFEVIFSRPV